MPTIRGRHCGADIARKPRGHSGPQRHYCGAVYRSAAARARGYVNPPPRPRAPRVLVCCVCGTTFEQRGSGRTRKTCSADCAAQRRRGMAAGGLS